MSGDDALYNRPATAGWHRAVASGPLTDPVTAITLLQTALSDRGIASTRIKVVAAGTAMLMAGEQIVLCRDGCSVGLPAGSGKAAPSSPRMTSQIPVVQRGASLGRMPACRAQGYPRWCASSGSGPGAEYDQVPVRALGLVGVTTLLSPTQMMGLDPCLGRAHDR